MMKLNIQLFANGSFTFDKSSSSSWQWLQGKIEWSSVSNGSNLNSSQVTAKLYIHTGTGGTSGRSWNGYLRIGNEQTTWDDMGSSWSGKEIGSTYVLMKTLVATINHNDDGSGSVNISASVTGPSGTSLSNQTTKGSKLVTLDTIPQASTITCGDTTINQTATIIINKKSESFSTTIYVKYQNQSDYILLVDKTYDKSYSYIVPQSLYNLIPTQKYVNCYLKAITYNGNNQIGEEQINSFRAYINETDSTPVISNTSIYDTKDYTELTGSNTKFIRYMSIPKMEWISVAKNGTTIKTQNINGVNVNSPYTSTSWYDVYNLLVTDNRGLTSSYSFPMNVVQYFRPSITADFKRKSPTSSEIILNLNGTFYNNSFGVKNNTAEFKIRYKKTIDSDYNEIIISPTINGNNFYLNNYSLGEISDYKFSWNFEAIIEDLVDKQSNAKIVTKGEPIYWWNDNNFYLNGILNTNGIKTGLDVLFEGLVSSDTTYSFTKNIENYKLLVLMFYSDVRVVPIEAFINTNGIYGYLKMLTWQQPESKVLLGAELEYVSNTQFRCAFSGYAGFSNTSAGDSWSNNPYKLTIWGIK